MSFRAVLFPHFEEAFNHHDEHVTMTKWLQHPPSGSFGRMTRTYATHSHPMLQPADFFDVVQFWEGGVTSLLLSPAGGRTTRAWTAWRCGHIFASFAWLEDLICEL